MKTYFKQFPGDAFGEVNDYAVQRSALGHNVRRLRGEVPHPKTGQPQSVIRVYFSSGPVKVEEARDVRAVKSK